MTLGDHNSTSRSGFSLIEALVVLAIGGMALAIIFSIGTKAGDAGFGLGRRAMAASEGDVAASDLRTIIRSIALRPSILFKDGVDKPAVGGSQEFSADVVMERATQCAPQGWAGPLTLRVDGQAGAWTVTCNAAGKKSVLLNTRASRPQLSYSVNGIDWLPSFSNAPRGGQKLEEIHSEALWIRLSDAATLDIIEVAATGRPEAWIRPDDGF